MSDMSPGIQLLGIGFYVATSIVLCTLGGRELDKVFDTGKTLTVIGIVFGLVLALYGGLRQLIDVLHAIDRRRREGRDE